MGGAQESWDLVEAVVVVAKSCLTLCEPMDYSPPGSSVHGISQARILEWVAISSKGSSQPRDRTHVSCIDRWILYHRTTWEASELGRVAFLRSEDFRNRWQYIVSSGMLELEEALKIV